MANTSNTEGSPLLAALNHLEESVQDLSAQVGQQEQRVHTRAERIAEDVSQAEGMQRSLMRLVRRVEHVGLPRTTKKSIRSRKKR